MKKAVFPHSYFSVHDYGDSNVASVEMVVERLGKLGVKLWRGPDKLMAFAVGKG
jgi:hypothetical protein